MVDDHDDHQARIARLDAMIERMNILPSLPQMAAQIRDLTQELMTLTARVDTLEQECEALRKEALIRFWETDAQEE